MANMIPDYQYTGKQVPMEEIRVLNMSCGTQIPAIRTDTFKIFTPGLLENIEKIQSIPADTQAYGSHERHKVDIYQSHQTTGPLLVFWYGGGMTRGNRTLQAVPKGLVYNNLGTFFASRGITTLVPDYRRVDSKHGGEGATYPSGGEDVALFLEWLQTSELTKHGRRDVYFLANSAGALHVCTFLFGKTFLEGRRAYVDGGRGYVQGAKELVGGGTGVSLKGVILLGMPGHFQGAAKDRKDKLKAYYGSEDKAAEECPLGLLEKLAETRTTLSQASIPKILALVAEYDPPDEIVRPMADFVIKFQETWNSEGIEFMSLKGHNHVSPIAALMSGDEVGEKWAEELAGWILGTGVPVEVDESAKEIPRGPTKKKSNGELVPIKKETGKTPHAQKLFKKDDDGNDDVGEKKMDEVDLNREGADGEGVGKGEKEPQPIEYGQVPATKQPRKDDGDDDFGKNVDPVDLNREGADGEGVGKGEKEPQPIEYGHVPASKQPRKYDDDVGTNADPVDLNREDTDGKVVGKGERDPKPIEKGEYIAPWDA